MSSAISIHWNCSCNSRARYSERAFRRHLLLVHPGQQTKGEPFLTLRMHYSHAREILRIWPITETLKVSRLTVIPHDLQTPNLTP
jgi:hypothetical protein